MHHRLQNNSTRAGIGPWIVICLLFTVLGCGTSGDEQQATPAPSKQSSSLALRAVFTNQAQVAESQAAVQCLVLRVTGPDLGTPISVQQVLTASQESMVFVAQIPIGANRTFTVEAFPEVAACQVGTAIPNFIPTFMGQSDPVTISPAGTTVTVALALVEKPVVRPPAPQEAAAGTEVTLPIVAGNPTGARVTCSATGLPPGLSIDPTTCLITGTLSNTAEGVYNVTITAISGTDRASTTFTLTIINLPPVANAGPDQTALVGITVQLDGSRSSDVDGDPLTFRWALTIRPLRSQATLVNPSTVNPAFGVDQPGTYVVQLIINDGLADSAPATVTIDTRNSRPVANAGPDQMVLVGTTVQLDGSRSSDVDGDLLTFRWVLTTRPPNSQATLSNPTLVNPTFGVDQLGTYVVQLIVNDGTLDSLPATITLASESRPVANAGPDQTVLVGTTVQLDGSRSSDVDGDPLTFRWALTIRPLRSQATLVNPSTVNPAFGVDQPGTYVVQLIINDGLADSAPATVTIDTRNSRPVANAGPDQMVLVGTTVQLDGSRSSDVDGDLLTFRWVLTTRPPNSQATLSNPTLVNPTFVVDQPGTYVVQLIVNDGTLDSLPATVTLASESRPMANTCPRAQTVFVGTTVQVDGSCSSDADGDPLTFRWALTTRPPNSQATLSNPTLVNPTFIVDQPGTYVVQLIVNDGTLDSLPATVTLASESRPMANTCPRAQTVFVGTTVQGDGSCSSDADGDPLTFRWALTTRPPNSQATLSNPTLVNPTFIVDQPGTYVVQLIVNDGTFDSAPNSVSVIAFATAAVMDPVGDAGVDPQVQVSPDLMSATVSTDGATLTLEVRFASGHFDSATSLAQFSLDTDKNPATGDPGEGTLNVDSGLIGTDFIVTIVGAQATVGEFAGEPRFNIVGTVSAEVLADGYRVRVPLTLLNNDNGLLNFKVVAATAIDHPILDVLPNLGLPPGEVK